MSPEQVPARRIPVPVNESGVERGVQRGIGVVIEPAPVLQASQLRQPARQFGQHLARGQRLLVDAPRIHHGTR